MNTSKFILIFLLSFFMASGVFAQEKNTGTSQLPQSTKQQGSVDVSNKKFDLDSLFRCINYNKNLISKATKDKNKLPLLLAISANKDSIIEILSDSDKEKDQKICIQDAELKIFRFFYIKDTSIFNCNEWFSLSEIPLCLQNHYQLILDIRKLDKLLFDIGQEIADIESNEYVKNLPDNSKQEVIKLAIKEDLEKADSLIGVIDEKDRSGLNVEQANYYRPLLVEMFNEFLDKIYAQ